MNTNTSDNYFTLLGLPVSFTIDKTKLTENYHEIQKSVHPDKFANSSDLERRLSVQKAAQINDALETLKNPTKRSIYILSLYDVELGENDTSIDPAFLMEQMELRKLLSEVESKEDPLGELGQLLDLVGAHIKQAMSFLDGVFGQLLSSSNADDAENTALLKEALLKEAKDQVLKLQFLNRLQEECVNKEDDLA
ncbi:MAG: Fe-S protein assembly co-chaperone HscB [Gammaproteobacteria bacterium]|nr:Fe-S protein assembly co-chaperone HscB [Gammaproteobacteria bacterium]